MSAPAAVLITGMSGVGKSTVLAALADRDVEVVDTDEPGWIVITDGERWWDLERVTALLDRRRDRPLAVQGTVANQGALYDRFAAVVLLTAPWPVIETRLRTRTTNDFGKDPEELTRIRRDLAEVEPLLRSGADHVIDTSGPLPDVVDAVERIVRGAKPRAVSRG